MECTTTRISILRLCAALVAAVKFQRTKETMRKKAKVKEMKETMKMKAKIKTHKTAPVIAVHMTSHAGGDVILVLMLSLEMKKRREKPKMWAKKKK